jgi:mannose-6-phosphate isomerase-like protein (cupin superfamily)
MGLPYWYSPILVGRRLGNVSKVGKTIQNPVSGEKFIFLKTAQETNGELLFCEWTLRAGSAVPYAHLHPRQTETFEVVEGELTVMMNGEELSVQAGEAITVPKGIAHQPRNKSEMEVRAYVTFRPALHMETRLEIVCGLATDSLVNHKGSPPFWQLAVLENAYPNLTYMAFPSIWKQRVLFKAGAVVGRILGYKAYYPRYCSQ